MKLLDDEVCLSDARPRRARAEGCRAVVCKFSRWMETGMLVHDDGPATWERAASEKWGRRE